MHTTELAATAPTSSRLKRTTRTAIFLALLSQAPLESHATDQKNAPRLTIAIVDLADIPAVTPPPRREPQLSWRTSFGSERQTQPSHNPEAALSSLGELSEADAVLIQGVRPDTPLRRMFPPSKWRLIVSRKILSPSDPIGFRAVRSDLPPVTAVAVKARKDIRVTARLPNLKLSETTPAVSAENPAAATAVRVTAPNGSTLWLASISFPSDCSAEDPPCEALTALDQWRRERRDGGEPTLVGGRIAVPTHSTSEITEKDTPTCASHVIESDLPWQHEKHQRTDLNNETSGNCISVIRIPE